MAVAPRKGSESLQSMVEHKEKLKKMVA